MGKIKPSISTIASVIAKELSLTHHKMLAYKYLIHGDFRVMIGLCVDPSGFSSADFYVNYFYMPLYRAVSDVNLSLGDRIGKWDKKELSVALLAVKNCYEQLPCDSIATILDKMNNHKLPYFGAIGNRYELLAYSYLVIEKYDEARHFLNLIVDFENDKNGIVWYEEEIKRAKQLLDLMDQGKKTEIRELLLGWQKYTMTELKLPE